MICSVLMWGDYSARHIRALLRSTHGSHGSDVTKMCRITITMEDLAGDVQI